MSRTACRIQDDGTIELYFYGELEEPDRATVAAHLLRCRECAQALEELQVIRHVLSARPDVSAPPSGDWTPFMQRLDAAVRPATVLPFAPRPASARPPLVHRRFSRLFAAAAMLALTVVTAFLAFQAQRAGVAESLGGPTTGTLAASDAGAEPGMQSALTAVGLRHLERSKLVVLGLAAKDAAPNDAEGWAYERELATSLLNDTRIYRQAAEARGLTRLASVMRDLELVLLQTAMAEANDAAALPQIQRLIHKRGLVEKMDVVSTTGLMP